MRRVVLLLTIVTLLGGCTPAGSTLVAVPTVDPPSPFVVPSPPPAAPVTDRCPPAPPAPVVVDPATVSLTQRAALVVGAGIPGATSAADPEARAVTALGVGTVILKRENIGSVEQTRALVEDLAAVLPLGVLVVVDHEGGRVAHASNVVPTTISPRRLGREERHAAREAGATIGTALRAAGIHATLAPVADLDDGPWDGIVGDRSFGPDPDTVVPAATAFLAGLHERGVLGVAKHFPGHAGATDPHAGPATAQATDLATHREPFRALVAADVDAVMVGHVTYATLGDLPASLNPRVYDLLRADGHDGVAITDSLGMGAVHHGRGHGPTAVAALAAGADLLLANQGAAAAAEMRDAVVAAVRSGDLDQARLDEAARRVMLLRARQAVVSSGCA